jgi:CRP-like cAMP-binding protein
MQSKRVATPDALPPPSIWAIPFGRSARGEAVELLSPPEQRQLAEIASLVQTPRDTVLCEEGDAAEYVYNLVDGVVESYRLLQSGERQVLAFLFAHDLFGLSENGRYVASVRAVTPALAYRIPVEPLRTLLRHDPTLEFHLLCKLCHELRAAQHHMMALWHKDAANRLALFLVLFASQMNPEHTTPREILLPVRHRDIADFLGLSIETVSRTMHQLTGAGLIERPEPRRIRVLDWRGLKQRAGMT